MRICSYIAAIGVVALCLTVVSPLRAQYTANFQTNLISGVTSNWSGDYYVGNTNSADVLQIQNGGLLHNNNGIVGWELSDSNTVIVTGTGSVWSNSADLSIGYSGTVNQVTIDVGGIIKCANGYIGSGLGSSNTLTVTGNSSGWMVTNTLYVGWAADANTLIASNGGWVSSKSGILGHFAFGISGNSSNKALIIGPGTVWSNAGSLYVGESGVNSTLAITEGGAVYDTVGYIGSNTTATDNSVLVARTGSVWSNRTALLVGYFGARNSLVISNGGQVSSQAGGLFNYSGYVGYNTSGSNNSVLVTGGGSVWNNIGGLNIGWNGAACSLTIANGGEVFDDYGDVGFNSGSSNNSVVVTGTASLWSNQYLTEVGLNGAGNNLVISNGARVYDWAGYLGVSTSSSNNSVLVTGADSTWNNDGSISVGMNGPGNSLVMSNGGEVTVRLGSFVGENASNSNSVRVVDNAVWWNDEAVHVGYQSSSNSLIVAGGNVYATMLTVGLNASTCDNLVQLDSGSIVVTNATTNAVLEVRNGMFILNGGTLQVDTLVITTPCARFYHNGGTLIVGNLVLDPNLSATGDGVPNWWKQQYGFDPLSTNGVNNANADPDGDGFTNLQEYLAGTDPTNSASAFRITNIVRTNNNDVLVTWTTGLAKTNALQSTTNFLAGYADIFTVTNTTGTATNYTDPGGATNGPSRYYRVRLVP